MAERLRFVVLTPHQAVFDEGVDSARVPTKTGQVGLRPRGEPFMTAVEPGLVLLTTGGVRRFAATAGGLLEGDRARSVLYTPFAVIGDEPEAVLAALEEALAVPNSEMDARRKLGELEDRIAEQLREGRSKPIRTGADHG
jgi:F0F1-type ATP synthase epsilon subunit